MWDVGRETWDVGCEKVGVSQIFHSLLKSFQDLGITFFIFPD